MKIEKDWIEELKSNPNRISRAEDKAENDRVPVTEATALGGDVNYDKESVPWVKPVLNVYEDIKKLKKVDYGSGILKKLIDQYIWLKSKGFDPGFYPGIGPLDTASLKYI